MKLRLFGVLLLAFAVLISGCGKSEKKEETVKETTEQSETAQQPGMTDTSGLEIEIAKVNKAIESLPEVGDKLIELSNEPNENKNQQQAMDDMLAQLGEVGKKYGFANGQEIISYVDFIVQIASMQMMMNNMDSILNELPDEQKNSPQVQQSIKDLKDKYEEAKKQYGDEVFSVISENQAKINNFFQKMQAMQAKQAQQQAQQQAEKFPQLKKDAQKDTATK